MINRQKHNTTCGLVAIKNALEFSGIKSTYKEMLDLGLGFLDFKHDGMNYEHLELGLDCVGVSTQRTSNVSFDIIRKTIDQGNSVILCYGFISKEGDHCGHYVFIDKYTKNSLRAWNWSSNLNEWCPNEKLAKSLRYSHRHCCERYPRLWVIKRKLES